MADRGHKAPTAISIAPLAEKSPFERFIGRYWPYIAGAALLAVAWVVLQERRSADRTEARNASWDRLAASTTNAGFPRVPTAKVEVFERVADEGRGTAAAPWSLLLAARQGLEDGDFAGSARTLAKLEAEYASHPGSVDAWPIKAGGGEASLVEYLSDTVRMEREWREQHASLFANPPPPETATRLRFRTPLGSFVVALYLDEGSEVARDFVSRCTDGSFTGTKICAATPGQFCEFGDASTRAEDRTAWGTGQPGRSVALDENGLHHFAGTVSIRRGDRQGEFAMDHYRISIAPSHDLEGESLVVGTVVEGLDVLTTIAAREQDPSRVGQLKDPVAIDGCDVLSSR